MLVFSRLSIRLRLIILVSFAILVLVITTTGSLLLFDRFDVSIGRIYDDRMVPLKLVQAIADDYSTNVLGAIDKAKTDLIYPDEALVIFTKARNDINLNWKEFRAHQLTPAEEALVIEIEYLFADADRYLNLVENTLIDMGDENNDELHQFDGALYMVIEPIHNKIIELVNYQLETAQQERQHAAEQSDFIGYWFMVIAIIAVLAMCVIGYLVAFSIIRPLYKLRHTIEEIEQNPSLSLQSPAVSNDEIGQLASAFYRMIQLRQRNDEEMEQLTQQTQMAFSELTEQKFMLDQHAIVTITDVQSVITYANEKFSQVSGYSNEELLGQNHRIVNSGVHDREFFHQMYQTIANGKVWHGEICNRDKDGCIYWVDATIAPFMGSDGKPKSYIALRTDITERKKAEIELINAKNMAEEAVHVKSQFLASMSHEIRTPMNGVLGMLSLLQNTQLDEDQQHRLSLAQSSAQSLLRLINDILDFSKVDAGKMELEALDFNLRNLLGELAEAMGHQAQDKNLELILNMTGIEHSMVKGDPGRLRQILTNIIGNAIKFTSQGEIVVEVNLQEVNKQLWQFNCSIRDTGIGIPADKTAKLFDSFSQVDSSTTRQYGGTGLGLAIVKKLCELMGGRVSVYSEPGKGSCFDVSVQLQKSEQSQQVLPSVDMQVLQLLIVDDNATNREVLRGQLEHWGASVSEAESGSKALSICEQQLQLEGQAFFDIAFLDMQMPDMDGAELGQLLKADPRFSSMKLIMMTSMGYQGDAKHFAELGFSGYFPKPTTTSDLFEALSVVAEGGDALQHAEPLVTSHYLKTLLHNENKASAKKRQKLPENIHILLVEDNSINQMVATGILNESGLQVVIAENGLEALQKLQQASASNNPFTLVLMDCQMPEMDGYEATRQIRMGKAGAQNTDIPIIAMTANAMQGDREKCLQAGMSDYLSKPIESEQLLGKLQQWLTDDATPLKSEKISAVENLPAQQKTNSVAPVWDLESVLERLMGKKDLLKTLLEVFFDESPERLFSLQQAIDANDSEQVRFFAHTIKGVAANLSGLRLQQQAALMEAAAKEENMQQIIELMPELVEFSEQLKQRFEQYIKNPDA